METDTVQNFPFGYMIRAFDRSWCRGIHLSARCCSHGCWNCCHLQLTYGVTALLAATANSDLPVAIAMAPTVANLFGWYQISGAANCVSVTAGVVGTAYQAAAGITSGVTANQKIAGGAQIIVAASSTFTKTGTTRNGSTEVFVSQSGCGIRGSAGVWHWHSGRRDRGAGI